MIRDLLEKNTKIHPEAFVAETGVVVGDVSIGEGSSIWYNAVLRGDMNFITVGKYTNVQDNASLHLDSNDPLIIGDYVTIGHSAIVHGCTIGDNCLIGMGSIILNGAVVGDNCIIGAGSLVTQGQIIPDNSLVMGSPGKVKRQVNEEEIETVRKNAIRYEKLWREEHKGEA